MNHNTVGNPLLDPREFELRQADNDRRQANVERLERFDDGSHEPVVKRRTWEHVPLDYESLGIAIRDLLAEKRPHGPRYFAIGAMMFAHTTRPWEWSWNCHLHPLANEGEMITVHGDSCGGLLDEVQKFLNNEVHNDSHR